MMVFIAGIVTAHLFWLLILLGIMVWDARAYPFVPRKRRRL